MSKSAMLRTRRRDVNVKPNRRLDRKSSRGMIYENEELRLRTININAEIERGQSDIKKLRKENEQLRKEIWCLRDEYDKLDRLLKEKEDCTSSSDSESCTSCSESEDPETTQNLENVQKTTLNSLRNDFDHLSVVTEETSAENSDKNSQNSGGLAPRGANWEVLPPDMGYPPLFEEKLNTMQNLHLNGGRTFIPQLGPPNQVPLLGGQTRTLPLPTTNTPPCPRHFFSPLKTSKSDEILSPPEQWTPFLAPGPILTTFTCSPPIVPVASPPMNALPPLLPPPPVVYKSLVPIQKTAPDIVVQTNLEETSSNSFVNGGNLDELLQDIDNISQDIYKISTNQNGAVGEGVRPFKSEISVVLMPQPMPLIGFDKYQAIKSSLESVLEPPGVLEAPLILEAPKICHETPQITPECHQTSGDLQKGSQEVGDLPKESQDVGEHPKIPHKWGDSPKSPHKWGDPFFKDPEIKTELEAPQKNPFFFGNLNQGRPPKSDSDKAEDGPQLGQSPTSKRTRKLSIYFKGNKKDKLERSVSLDAAQKHIDSPLLGGPKTDPKDSEKSSDDKKHRKSSSTSPERRHVHIQDNQGGHTEDAHKKRHKKRSRKLNRRKSISMDKFHRDRRSLSVCTDRSNILEHRLGFDELLTNSERDRSNSLSSCDTIKSRKTSQIPPLPVSGKIPWFGCWGNGCL